MAQYQKIPSITVLLAITIATHYGGAMAQSSGCTSALVSLSPCLNYLSGNTSTPSSGCCSQLANVVQSQPQCLCEVLNGGGSSLGLSINQTQALAIPEACNVQTPPTSRCNVGSPGNSPTPGTIGVPSGKGVPSTNNGSSDAYLTKFTAIPIVSLLLVATYAVVF
ncbi:hypothetical protein LXL04_033280 [Taraxacum kok-saghyz]